MSQILLIARREYVQYIRTRGFWLSILMFPIFVGLGAIIPVLIERSAPVRHYVLVDRAGGFAERIDAAFEADHRALTVRAFALYARVAADPEAIADGRVDPVFVPVSVGEAEVEAFMAAGGLERAQEAVAPYLGDAAIPFTAPRRNFVRVDLPPEIDTGAPLADIAAALEPYLTGREEIDGPDGGADLFAAVLIPDSVAGADWSGETVQYWSANLANDDLRQRFRSVINDALREREFERRGIDSETIGTVQDLAVEVRSFDPRKTERGGAVSLKDQIELYMPFALAYILWVGVFTVANILLTNVIEEKSNKIVEVLLSSVTAHQLMIGKLIGVLGLGLTTVSVLIGGTLGVLQILPGRLSEVGAPITDLLLSTPLLPFFLFYFLIGYLIYASIFLAVGSMCNALSDAQSYLTPLILVLMLPLGVLFFIPRDPNGLIAVILSWVPIYSPFIMMMRVSADPPLFELVGTAIMMVLFAGFVLWLMGRLFRRSILRGGKVPRLRDVFGILRGAES